jgi:hypothetical protein
MDDLRLPPLLRAALQLRAENDLTAYFLHMADPENNQSLNPTTQDALDAKRYRALKSKATKHDDLFLPREGCIWKIKFFSGDPNLSFDEAVDSVLRVENG